MQRDDWALIVSLIAWPKDVTEAALLALKRAWERVKEWLNGGGGGGPIVKP